MDTAVEVPEFTLPEWALGANWIFEYYQFGIGRMGLWVELDEDDEDEEVKRLYDDDLEMLYDDDVVDDNDIDDYIISAWEPSIDDLIEAVMLGRENILFSYMDSLDEEEYDEC